MFDHLVSKDSHYQILSFWEVELFFLLPLNLGWPNDFLNQQNGAEATSWQVKWPSGLPWWLSGKESACQCRRHRFDPWSRKSPHVSEQLSPCASTIELVLWSLGAITTELTCLSYWKLCTLELVLCSKRSHHNEKPLHHNENATREKPTRQRRPDTAENKYTNFKNYIWKPLCGY